MLVVSFDSLSPSIFPLLAQLKCKGKSASAVRRLSVELLVSGAPNMNLETNFLTLDLFFL